MKSNKFLCLSTRDIDERTVSSVVEYHIIFDSLPVDSPNKLEHIIYEIGDEIPGDQASEEEKELLKLFWACIVDYVHLSRNIPL